MAPKAAAKQLSRKAPAKKQTRNPLGTATAAYREAEKKLASAKKAYDRALVIEARAAEKLRTVKEKIAAKTAKQTPANQPRNVPSEAESGDNPPAEFPPFDPSNSLND